MAAVPEPERCPPAQVQRPRVRQVPAQHPSLQEQHPLAQRIELKVLDPALGDGAGAKAFEGQL